MNSKTLRPLPHSVQRALTIPGSKSYTNRALVLACMTKDIVTIKNVLISDDTKAMTQCLKTLGIKIRRKGNCIIVSGSIWDVSDGEYTLNAGLSGTTIRFLSALAVVTPGTKIITGRANLRKRPIGDLVDALRQLNPTISYVEETGFPPIKIAPSNLKNHTLSCSGTVSSQYISALLMIAPIIGLKIRVVGTQVSKPYITMTTDSMKQFGVKIINHNFQTYEIKRQPYHATDYLVEGDLSSASYFTAVAVLTKSKITLRHVSATSLQADKEFFTILERMGNRMDWQKNQVTVTGNKLTPVAVNMAGCPDQVQTLAVLAAFARGTTIIHGIQTLRVKETDRVKALQIELKKMGIKTEVTPDTLTIHGGNPKKATIDTYGDHRMAMSFAVAGTKLTGMTINDPGVVSKTFPDFWEKLAALYKN